MRLSSCVGSIAVSACLWASAASATTLLVSPLSFDFGDVFTGATAPEQNVTITNVTTTTQSLSLAGGAAGVFGGSTTCGSSLAPGASCDITYRLTPTALGDASRSTTLSVNGEAYTFDFKGNGIDPLLVTPTSLNFGTVGTGSTSSSQTVTITNLSGATQSLSLAGGAAGVFGGSTSCGSSLAPGATCDVTYQFTPTASGDASRTTTLSVNGVPYTFSFAGAGGTVSASPFLVTPLSFDFGDVFTASTSPSQMVTITNVTATTQSLSLAGGAAGVFGGSTTCGSSLAPGETCNVAYRFEPTALGDASRTTTLSINGELYTFELDGSGLNPILVSPLSFDFGDIEVGTTSPFQTVEILNLSDVIQSLSLAGGAAGVFGGTTTCGSSLAPGASCDVTYRFEPTTLGDASRTTTLAVNGIAKTISFKGVGVGPDVAAMPEPMEATLLGGGLFMLAAFRRRSRALT